MKFIEQLTPGLADPTEEIGTYPDLLEVKTRLEIKKLLLEIRKLEGM